MTTRPGICLVLAGPTLEDCRRQLEDNRPWIDLAEVRADKIGREDWPALNDFSREAGLPLVLTLRQPRHGGDWTGSPDAREAFFEQALDGVWAWADVEDDQRMPDWEARWRAAGHELIVSFHELEGLGVGWLERIRRTQATLAGTDGVVKAALMPRSSRDYLTFVQGVLSLPTGRRVLLAMGGVGFTSRVLTARFGSLWTYASPTGNTIAPGQTDPQTLVELYRYRLQTRQTPVYGVVGNPVFHSKSPHIHNPGLAALGLPGTYVPFLADDVQALLRTAELLGVRGLSCTIPHKQAVLPLLESASGAVEAIGAANTLVRTPAGWRGDNTDARGFLEPLSALQRSIHGSGALSAAGVTVIGTGGAARAIVWALAQAGCRVLVLGRDLAKAEALAAEFGVQAAHLGPESLDAVKTHASVLVQTTSVGMGDQEGKDPLPWYEFTGNEIAYDIVYAPQWTSFLERARQAGCQVLFGRQMLDHQAWLQFGLFTGVDYPTAKMGGQPGEGQ
ncbi:MAG: type I 3-dehydroquinate dehydratase [Spirochaetales bacterium]